MNKIIGVAHAAAKINQSNASLELVIYNALTNVIMPALTALAVAAIIYSGVLYMISQGEPDKVAKAKRSLLWPIVGLFLIIMSVIILAALNSVVGTKIIR
jgi:hypothetical protein